MPTPTLTPTQAAILLDLINVYVPPSERTLPYHGPADDAVDVLREIVMVGIVNTDHS